MPQPRGFVQSGKPPGQKAGRQRVCLFVLYSSPKATLTALMAKVMVRPMAMPAIRQG